MSFKSYVYRNLCKEKKLNGPRRFHPAKCSKMSPAAKQKSAKCTNINREIGKNLLPGKFIDGRISSFKAISLIVRMRIKKQETWGRRYRGGKLGGVALLARTHGLA